MDEPIRLEPGQITTITVDRPDSLNALNRTALAAFEDALDEAEAASPRVLVLTGAGEDAFVAGADVSEMRDLSTEAARSFTDRGQRLTRRIASFPAPTIAAINGHALGGGLELALACDLRVASERAILGLPEVDLGIIPAWGGTQRLPELVGDELARRLIYFGERVDAQDAHELGLVGDVVAHDEIEGFVDDLAEDLAGRPRHALRAAKAAIDRAGDGESGLAYERDAAARLFGTADQREGMAAFLEGREPEYE